MARAAQAERLRNVDFFASDEYRLTRARFVSLPRAHLLAARHMGPYGPLNESFGDDDNPWTRLLARARAAGLPIAPTLVGLFYDDPTMTPPDLQRTDVCVVLMRPVEGTDSLRCIPFDGGLYAIASYVGRIDYTFREGPPLEFLRAPNLDGRAGVHHIDVCFPIEKTAKRPARQQESSRPSRPPRGRLSRR
jgi:DNA gyrase inhibitor GyrI